MFDYSLFFFFKQKTAYELRISDWSSDVCSSDLGFRGDRGYFLEFGAPVQYRLDLDEQQVIVAGFWSGENAAQAHDLAVKIADQALIFLWPCLLYMRFHTPVSVLHVARPFAQNRGGLIQIGAFLP